MNADLNIERDSARLQAMIAARHRQIDMERIQKANGHVWQPRANRPN